MGKHNACPLLPPHAVNGYEQNSHWTRQLVFMIEHGEVRLSRRNSYQGQPERAMPMSPDYSEVDEIPKPSVTSRTV